MPITYIIIGLTVLISMAALNNHQLFQQLKHWPYAEARRNEKYRWLTGGFLHGDNNHLFFNMLTLYFFGPALERYFTRIVPEAPSLAFGLFYLLAIVAASLATYVKYKDHSGFSSIGASGATAAVLFACILFNPTIGIMMFFIPIPIPGFIFAILYLWYSAYSADKGGDNIDHTAHYYGAVFGFVFPLVFDPYLFVSFLETISGWISNIF